MGLTAFRIKDSQIQEWYNKKQNKSETNRTALRMLYESELQKNYAKQEKKLEVEIIG